MEDNKRPATDYIEDYMSEQPMIFAFRSVAKSRRHHRRHHLVIIITVPVLPKGGGYLREKF